MERVEILECFNCHGFVEMIDYEHSCFHALFVIALFELVLVNFAGTSRDYPPVFVTLVQCYDLDPTVKLLSIDQYQMLQF